MSVMMMLVYLFLVVFVVNLLSLDLFMSPSRYSFVKFSLLINMKSIFTFLPISATSLYCSLLTLLAFLNLFSNIPMVCSPVMYYYFTITLSTICWLGLIFVVMQTQFTSFLSHMMPYGAPMFLSSILPLIELFSQLIRPFTLSVRLSTNLSAGHIMMFMFSFFSTFSMVVSVLILIFMVVLSLLEGFISVLQAYIFVSLSSMYMEETF